MHSDVKQKGVAVIEWVDTTKISDERMKTNQFLGSNMQVANLVSPILA